jgi:uncharacterized membrane protein AbrB (regulator of aidB expression)
VGVGPNDVPKNADAVDLDFDHVSVLHINRRVSTIANSARVTLTGVFSEIDPSLAEGLFHEAEGWVIFVVALVMLVAVHLLLNWVYRRFRHEPTVPKEQILA